MVDFKQLCKESFNEINLVRTNPELFIFPLEQMAKLFKDDVLHIPGEIALKTKEGVSAVYDCIEFLKTVKPVGLLNWSEEIAHACQDLADDIGPKNIVGHVGSDGLNMSKRLEKYGDWSGSIAENIDFGSKTGKNVVLSGIIDDGDLSRGYRKNLFNPKFKNIGIGAAKHGAYGTCVVINYAEVYNKKGEKKSNVGGMNYEEYHKELPKKGGVSYTSYSPEENFNKSETTTTKTTTEKFSSSSPTKYKNESPGIKKGGIENDQDKPEGAISTKITKNISIKNGKKTTIEKKIYTMNDGSTQIIENETIEEEK